METGEIIAANSAVAGGADLTPAIAGKTALQNAGTQLAEYLIPRIKAAIDEGRVSQSWPDKSDLWRQQHPPYLLYCVAAALGVFALVAVFAASLSHQRRVEQMRSATAATRGRIDPRLSGGGPPEAGSGGSAKTGGGAG